MYIDRRMKCKNMVPLLKKAWVNKIISQEWKKGVVIEVATKDQIERKRSYWKKKLERYALLNTITKITPTTIMKRISQNDTIQQLENGDPFTLLGITLSITVDTNKDTYRQVNRS